KARRCNPLRKKARWAPPPGPKAGPAANSRQAAAQTTARTAAAPSGASLHCVSSFLSLSRPAAPQNRSGRAPFPVFYCVLAKQLPGLNAKDRRVKACGEAQQTGVKGRGLLVVAFVRHGLSGRQKSGMLLFYQAAVGLRKRPALRRFVQRRLSRGERLVGSV